MAVEEQKSSVLPACLGKGQRLNDLVGYSTDSIISKTIVDKPTGTITLFSFDKGQKLSEHTSPYDAVVQVLDGWATLTIGGQIQQLPAGEIIVMTANVPHAVDAEERFKMLLTMIRV